MTAAREAHVFLREVPTLEASGVNVRVPGLVDPRASLPAHK